MMFSYAEKFCNTVVLIIKMHWKSLQQLKSSVTSCKLHTNTGNNVLMFRF